MAYPYTANQDLTSAELNTDFAARPTATEVATLTNKTISSGTLTGTTTLPGSGQISSAGLLGLGGSPNAAVDLRADISSTAWSTSGIGFRGRVNTYTDTSSSGTVAATTLHSLLASTIAASSVTTYTLASGLRVNAPVAGTNVTFTNAYGLHVATGGTRVVGGVAYIGVTYANRPSGAEAGTQIYVTDSTVNTFRATVAGGGANKVLAWFDGTNWLCAG